MCNVLCHAGATAAASSPKPGVAGCQEKECFPAERAPEAGPPCGCGTATSKLLPEGSHGKKQRRDRRAEPVLPGGCLRDRPAEAAGTHVCLHFVLGFFFLYFCVVVFLLSPFIGIFICLLELIGFNGAL